MVERNPTTEHRWEKYEFNIQFCLLDVSPVCLDLHVVTLGFGSSRQLNMSTVDETTSAAQPADQQDDLHYANIHTSLNHSYALYANCGLGQPRSQAEEEDEEDGVEYSVIMTRNASSAPRSAAPPT